MLHLTKSAIPWCDYGASPVTGCQHGCRYCYARSMVRRYGWPDDPGLHELEAPMFGPRKSTVENPMADQPDQPYPFGFAPTLHRYRLDGKQKRKPGRVFICPMADMWGSWVPEAWQDEVLAACTTDQRHDYLFLTKRPELYCRVDWSGKPWAWLGATATTFRETLGRALWLHAVQAPVKFLSMEPWLSGDDGIDHVVSSMRLDDISGGPPMSDWLILGPLTGPKARTAPPVSRDTVLRLRDACQRAGVALFVKPSATAWGLTPDEIATMQAFPRPHPSER